MKAKHFLWILTCMWLLSACTLDRELPVPHTHSNDSLQVVPGLVVINEFLAKGSANTNEFGAAEDWLELFNTSNLPLTFAAGRWFVTDDVVADSLKYSLPSITLPAYGHLLIWCDDMDTVAQSIHTNFKLSSAGDHLGLFYLSDSGYVRVDAYAYGPQTVDAASEGRSPDGSSTWVQFASPTPGGPNQ